MTIDMPTDDISAREYNFATCRWRKKSNRSSQSGLTASGFSNYRDRHTLPDTNRYAIYGTNESLFSSERIQSLTNGKILRNIFRLENCFTHTRNTPLNVSLREKSDVV